MDKSEEIELNENDESPFRPADEMVIDNLEVLKAVSDPLRLRIIELLAEPHTVKEIAPQLKIGKTKLYYHINLLEKYGVIRVVRTRLVSGIVEKSYQIAAMRFRPTAELFGGDEGKEQGLAVFDSIFDVTRADFVRSVKSGNLDTLAASKEKKLLVGRTIISLTEEKAKEFNARFDALMEELANYEKPTPNSSEYVLTIAFFPKIGEQ